MDEVNVQWVYGDYLCRRRVVGVFVLLGVLTAVVAGGGVPSPYNLLVLVLGVTAAIMAFAKRAGRMVLPLIAVSLLLVNFRAIVGSHFSLGGIWVVDITAMLFLSMAFLLGVAKTSVSLGRRILIIGAVCLLIFCILFDATAVIRGATTVELKWLMTRGLNYDLSRIIALFVNQLTVLQVLIFAVAIIAKKIANKGEHA